jgi:hypothetical protein
MFVYRLSCLLVLLLTVSACGFQLRAYNQADLSAVKLLLTSETPYARFEKVLKNRLRQSGVNLIKDNQKPKQSEGFYHLQLISIDLKDKGISRDQSGRSNETEVTITINFKFNQLTNMSDKPALIETEEGIESSIHSISEIERYYQDYRDPTARFVQKKETENLLMQKASEQLISFIQHRLEQQ